MKTTIMQMIVVAALSFSGAALAAAESKGRVQTPQSAASAVPPAPTVKPPAPETQPAVKPLAPAKPTRAKPPRPKNLDLRHCLKLESDAAIAKCAGE